MPIVVDGAENLEWISHVIISAFRPSGSKAKHLQLHTI